MKTQFLRICGVLRNEVGPRRNGMRFRSSALAATAFALTFSTVYMVRRSGAPGSAVATPAPAPPDSGTAVVLLVAPNCRACNDPALLAAWQTIRSNSAVGPEPYVIGVATSGSASDGIDFLARFGQFHEVLAGGGWAGVGADHYVFSDLRGSPTVPQVVILDRRVATHSAGVNVSERVIHRRSGLDEIVTWARQIAQPAATRLPSR